MSLPSAGVGSLACLITPQAPRNTHWPRPTISRDDGVDFGIKRKTNGDSQLTGRLAKERIMRVSTAIQNKSRFAIAILGSKEFH
ncbi:hypothetical protein Nepgr_028857 [Nepenthes gracilis]|uniref:Uncharacterized protein n=1 Tax=Nepenthes gracilis TaxID=150966 RepID=A0AAD3Y4G5_NEPGR|nr:hypothetical protein Nepgr_028857 [Nepenthes gracilis]